MIIKVTLDTRRPTSEGKYTVRLSFANLGKTVYSSLNIFVHESEFDSDNQILFTNDKKTQVDNKRHNSYIISEINRANNLLNSLQLSGRDRIQPSRFKEIFLKRDKQEAISFNTFFRSFIDNKSGRTKEIYEATLSKVEKYFGQNIYFDDITHSWLESFDRKMQKEKIKNRKGNVLKTGLETNARGIHFRNIRAVFNNAIDNEIVGLELYPFRRFKIKKEKTIKRSMKLNDVQILFSHMGTKQQNWSIDIAKIIFFMIGINVKDLYNLKAINDDNITYKRAKTKRLYNIYEEPELKILLDKYKSNDGLVFKEQFKLYQSFCKKINKYLAESCKETQIPKITTYSLRHTWATIAASLDIPKETIAAALGHGGNSTTDIYIDFDRTKIDEANRKVIDHVLNIKREVKK